MTDQDNSVSEKLIEEIFYAADGFRYLTTPAPSTAWLEADARLQRAIDAAMSHAFGEGYAMALEDQKEVVQ